MINKANELSDQHILLIDDDLPLLEVIECAFALAGYQVYTAMDAQAGFITPFVTLPKIKKGL